MASIDSEYDLTDEDREIIAEDLKAVASEEDFQKWFKKFSTLASAKNKSAKKAMAEKMKEEETKEEKMKMVKSSEETIVTAAAVEVHPEMPEEVKAEVEAAKAIAEAAINNDIVNAAGAVESLKDRMASAFGGDNIKIKLNR